MRAVRIDQVRPGDVTADHVRNEAGGVLIAPGTVLTEVHLRRLKIAGVEMVPIGGTGNSQAENPARNMQRLQCLESRFAGVTDPLLLDIKKIVSVRLQSIVDGAKSAK